MTHAPGVTFCLAYLNVNRGVTCCKVCLLADFSIGGSPVDMAPQATLFRLGGQICTGYVKCKFVLCSYEVFFVSKVSPISKSRLFHLVFYPDSESYSATNVLSNFVATSQFVPPSGPQAEFAYILHDSDVGDDGNPLKPHYHVVLRFSSPRSYQSVCNLLGLPLSSMSLPDASRTSNLSFRSLVRYLPHLDSPKKYQYDFSLVVSNFDVSQFFDSVSDKQSSAFLELLDFVLRPDATKHRVAVYAAQAGILSYYRMYYRMLWDIRSENLTRAWMADLDSEEIDRNYRELAELLDKFSGW